jgi:hypothetical protein
MDFQKNWKKWLMVDTLALFVGLTAWTVYQHGYVGFFELAMANWATRLMFVDLSIALALFVVWMVQDARATGTNWLPYAVVTLFFGAAGPLLYLIRRPGPPRSSTSGP